MFVDVYNGFSTSFANLADGVSSSSVVNLTRPDSAAALLAGVKRLRFAWAQDPTSKQ